ncbi:MAG: thioredoxin domain-containing protein [bacterium]|nr:thioredoxin domain-containing protein [bacterium]
MAEDVRPPNHLQGQTSPYLLQHLYNPVDWHPWGDEALALAAERDCPIFLSIGYAACHWCHVMERESFEDEQVAELLNEHFVSIKVDREERPDIDDIYMTAVQMRTGQGGWPLSVFLTPQLEPFMGGTYFPPTPRHGLIAFPDLLQRIVQVWTTRRDDAQREATALTERLTQIGGAPADSGGDEPIGHELCAHAAGQLSSSYDSTWGGFGPPPKFPPDGALGLLLREHARTGEGAPLDMTCTTLEAMASGGMYDQVGGGFARYSVDERWLVPHFEKMLYNQALLVPLYADASVLTGAPLFRRVVEETLDFARRELSDADGGFWSSLDADSEGHEGVFYVWKPEQILEALGAEDGALFNRVYGVEEQGNFEGRSIVHLLQGGLTRAAQELGTNPEDLVTRLAPLRRQLLEARGHRERPATDDKVLTSWNGLMLSALCRAHQVFGRAEDLDSAIGCAEFLQQRMTRDGRLLASYRRGKAQLNGYLDDYAFVARGLIELYETVFDRRWLDAALGLARAIVDHFEDEHHGGFFFTSDDHERLLTRSRTLHDGALPAGAGVAAETLLRLGAHFDDDALRNPARRLLTNFRSMIERMPSAHGSLLAAADFNAGPVVEIALVGDANDPAMAQLRNVAHRRFLPRKILAGGSGDETETPRHALLAGKKSLEGKPTAYVCRDYTCREPTTDPVELARQLDDATG